MRLALLLLVFATPLPGADAQQIARAAAHADLDTLRAIVHRYSAYRLLNKYPFDRHLDSLKTRMPDSVPLADLWHSVQTLIGRLQDAHSNVPMPAAVRDAAPTGELPFALTSVGDTVVALSPCRCALFVRGHPRVVSINGLTIDSLMRVAGFRFRGHSPQRFRLRALMALTQIEHVLARAGAKAGRQLTVRLTGNRGDTTVRVAMAPRRTVTLLPPSVTAAVSDSIAILRIPLMLDRYDSLGADLGYEMVRAAMESRSFRASRAMIIDVRGNDGGTRHILEYLVPYFIREPLVYNVAVVRVDTNGVGDRSLLSPNDTTQPSVVRTALRKTLTEFKPAWDYSGDSFLPGRFGAVLLPVEPSRNMSDRPVVVLMDEGSFSATDIFLGAMSLAPNVTLMGLPSGGGSGRSRGFDLPNSRLRVIISTMASFRPDGQVYDGVGITPDIIVPRTLEGVASDVDTQMAEAIRFLRQRISPNP
jgi:C-terminal processing protease CtpA/Prc